MAQIIPSIQPVRVICGQIVELENTSTKLGVVNSIIQQANAIIVEFNKKVVGIDG